MMPSEIESYLQARKGEKIVRRLFVIAVVGLVTAGLIRLFFDASNKEAHGVILCAFGIVFGFWLYEGKLSVPRSRLMEIIENQIKRNPDALAYLESIDKAAQQAASRDRSKTRST